MKLDLHQPLFVFVGAWNPAIFQPGWIARHLFEFPEGSSVEAALLMSPNEPHITFIQGVGVAVSTDKVRLFVQSFDGEVVAQAEKVAKNLFKTLPHTPFGAFGVNFVFREDEPNDSLYDSLKTADGIERQYKVVKQEFTSTIELDMGVLLNFKRTPFLDFVTFDLNFHHSKVSTEEIESTLTMILKKYHEVSISMISKLYGLEQGGTIVIDQPKQKGSEAVVAI